MDGFATTTVWSPAENKAFEVALAELDIAAPDLFERLAGKFPSRTREQLRSHYMLLLADIERIERAPAHAEGQELLPPPGEAVDGAEVGTAAPTVNKGKPWTEEEHKLFLMGMSIQGRGSWKSIANNFVHTRSATQIASHAQKFFRRHSDHRKKRRPSILDITTVGSIAKPRIMSIYDLFNLGDDSQSSLSSMLSSCSR